MVTTTVPLPLLPLRLIFCRRSTITEDLTKAALGVSREIRRTHIKLRYSEETMRGGLRRGSGACLRCFLFVFAVASALYVSGPALYWRFKRGNNQSSSLSCASCVCDCPPPLSLEKIAPGLLNLSVPDCGKNDPELRKEMEKQFVDLLTEELQLLAAVSQENTRHMNLTLREARKMASQYQKEAEKCNSATEICEEAREHAEATLRMERKVTAKWERRARESGWTD